MISGEFRYNFSVSLGGDRDHRRERRESEPSVKETITVL